MPIKTKLVFILLAFTFVPMFFLGTFVFYHTRKDLKNVRLAQLENIADLKKDRIEAFFNERKGDLFSAQGFYLLKRNLPVLSRHIDDRNGPAYARAEAELDMQVKAFQKGYGYVNIMLIDARGRTVYVSNGEYEEALLGRPFPDAATFDQGRAGIYFTDVHRNEKKDRFEMFAVAPLTGFAGEFIGEIATDIDMGPIYRFIQDSTGLGRTGEEIVARKDGDAVLLLSPLRHAPRAAMKKRIAFSERFGLPAQRAVQGENGSGAALDYNGDEVLAAWRYIPFLRWGLVTKISTSEAFAPVSDLRNIALLFGFIILAAGIAAALLTARSLSRPIVALQRGAERVGGGDLDYRVGSDAQDEMGKLSRAFDAMTSSLREINKELRLKAATLEATNKELESFSYSVSHDLRAPLRHMSGFIELLRKNAWDLLDETGRRYVSLIAGSSDRMGRLIDDLLAFSRIGRSEMHMRSVNMDSLVRSVIRDMATETKDRTICWEIGTLPAVYGDPSLIRLMLVNMLSNAVKFTRHRPEAKISVGFMNREGLPAFFVGDNGVGFDMKYVDKIFEVFQRLHYQEHFEGTGIGLANVRRIVLRHGGRIWAEGAVDSGATFYFTLPLSEGETGYGNNETHSAG